MATIVFADNLVVCTDCAILIANAEGTEALAAAQVEQWGEHATGLVLAGCEPCDDFSTRHCDGCGNTDAGERHAAAVLTSNSRKAA